jgi:hypothetical protein
MAMSHIDVGPTKTAQNQQHLYGLFVCKHARTMAQGRIPIQSTYQSEQPLRDLGKYQDGHEERYATSNDDKTRCCAASFVRVERSVAHAAAPLAALVSSSE